MSDFITNQDRFGHDVKLNIDKDQETHKTMFGGICSVAINLLMGGYILYLFYLMFWNENSQESITSRTIEIDKKEALNVHEMNLLSFYHIMDGEKKLDLNNKNYTKYMDFKFVQVTVKDGIEVEEEFEAVECNRKHLTKVKKSDINDNLFELWEGKTILCPRIEDYQ